MATYPEVTTVTDLPDPSTCGGEIYEVLEATHAVSWEERKVGLWQSNGYKWTKVNQPMTFEAICVPPPGYCEVVNLYVDPETQKLVVEYEDTLE